MKHNDKKIGKIIDELTMFLLIHKCNDININVHTGSDYDKLTFKFIKPTDELVDLLVETLSQEREETIEEYGWELLGENDCSCSLNLIGMCLDSCEFKTEDDLTVIEMIRKK